MGRLSKASVERGCLECWRMVSRRVGGPSNSSFQASAGLRCTQPCLCPAKSTRPLTWFLATGTSAKTLVLCQRLDYVLCWGQRGGEGEGLLGRGCSSFLSVWTLPVTQGMASEIIPLRHCPTGDRSDLVGGAVSCRHAWKNHR